jgi:hypothetical protein
MIASEAKKRSNEGVQRDTGASGASSPPSPSPTRCSRCGKEVSEDCVACPYCGLALGVKCPSCGKDLKPEFIVCPFCGAVSTATPDTKVRKKLGSKTWTRVLGEVLVVAISLSLSYIVLTPALSLAFGIDLPQIIYTPKPRQVALSNPHHREGTAKEVRPEEIQKILDAHPYDRPYQKDVFDCSDMSIITAKLLQRQYGYDTSVIGDDRYGHAWVYVWVDKNTAWAIEATASEVIGDQWWDIVFYGRWFEGKAWELSSTGYRLYYPQERRDGLQVREWYEVEEGR